ncbi:glycoside hydrolase [Olivibacter sp. SDN3]|nr:glycoside hydrolase [Olivibacter sp. SDN3]
MQRRLEKKVLLSLCFLLNIWFACSSQEKPFILQGDVLKEQVAYFNSIDDESVVNFVPNANAYDWLIDNVPLFECPDSTIQRIYYYRWWSFRKHLKETPHGFIFTEFIEPVSHAGKYNAISCALGHHIYEGRWLHNPEYINQYIDFWLLNESTFDSSKFHAFSSWLSDAVHNLYLVNYDRVSIAKWLPLLDEDYERWEEERQLPGGMFWQYDVRDGMEESVSGGRKIQNRRPTINSYMYGNARALGKIASLLGNETLKQKYQLKANQLKQLVLDSLWDDTSKFFRTQHPNGKLAPREAIGFIPWYFNLPPDDANYQNAWLQLQDTAGFKAPWGLTTAERREPTFRTRGSGHGCEWDGAIWPFATTQTLKALANFLTTYQQNKKINPKAFYDEILQYAVSHQKNGQPYLGEYQDERTGYWLKGDNPRSSFYNHSGFCDLIINDLIGLKPVDENSILLKPLVPPDQWEWFCLDNVLYNGRILTIVWDKTGKRYGKGEGLTIFSNGKKVSASKKLENLKANLN